MPQFFVSSRSGFLAAVIVLFVFPFVIPFQANSFFFFFSLRISAQAVADPLPPHPSETGETHGIL